MVCWMVKAQHFEENFDKKQKRNERNDELNQKKKKREQNGKIVNGKCVVCIYYYLQCNRCASSFHSFRSFSRYSKHLALSIQYSARLAPLHTFVHVTFVFLCSIFGFFSGIFHIKRILRSYLSILHSLFHLLSLLWNVLSLFFCSSNFQARSMLFSAFSFTTYAVYSSVFSPYSPKSARG